MIAIEEIETLNKEQLGLITVVTGEDLGQFSQLKKKLMDRIGYDKNDLMYSYFDMSLVAYQDIAIELESLPFFDQDKIVILDDFLDITTSKKSYLDEKELKCLETYLENPVETTHLIIFSPGKLDSKRRLVKLLKRDAKIFEARMLKESELKTYVQKIAHGYKLTFASGGLDALLLKSNYHFDEIFKNITFLTSYKKDAYITVKDIEQAIPKTLQDNIFHLTQFVLNRHLDKACELIYDLKLQGEDEIKLIAIMIGQFRLFLQVSILQQQGKNEHQMVTSLSDYIGRRINPYQIKFSLRDSKTLSISFLKRAIATLIETDYAIKNGLYDPAYLFDLAILKIVTNLR